MHELKELIQRDLKTNNTNYKLINTGTIGKYFDRWGDKECTYLKHKFLYPVVNIHEFEV